MILVRGGAAGLAIIVAGRIALFAPQQIADLAANLRDLAGPR
jgi:hypothetical protein